MKKPPAPTTKQSIAAVFNAHAHLLTRLPACAVPKLGPDRKSIVIHFPPSIGKTTANLFKI